MILRVMPPGPGRRHAAGPARILQVLDQRQQMRRVEGAQGVGGGGAGQARQVQPSAEVSLVLDEPQRAVRGSKKASSRPRNSSW